MKLHVSVVAGIVCLLSACASAGGGGGGGAGSGGGVASRAGNALITPMSSIGLIPPWTWTVANAKYQVQQNGSIKVSWDKGSLAGKTRTFVPDILPPDYVLDSTAESGLLTVITSTGNAAAVEGLIAESNPADNGAFGLVHVGTTPTNLPSSGTLTYARAEGIVLHPMLGQCGISSDCVGDVNIAANFSAGTVSGTFSNFNGGLGNVGFNGTMNTGNTLYSSDSLTYGGSPTDGILLGGFYGPGASDTAGVLDVTAGSVHYLGGYAATRAP
jgi:hypothetical protein